MEKTITNQNFKEVVLENDKPVLVDFWATWCGPCKMLAPIIEEIADEKDDICVGKVNVDDEGELAAQFGITSIPTLLVFKDGKCVNKAIGYMEKERVLSLLD